MATVAVPGGNVRPIHAPRRRQHLLAGFLLLCWSFPALAQQPLHERIDQLVAAGTESFESVAAPPADDAEFLRRIYLDLTGTIPTADETRAFLANESADKRAKLIDRLLESPEYARHMARVFDIMLMERRGGNNVPGAEWEEYLRKSFAENKPYDQLAREILGADGSGETRAAAKFYLDRNGETDLLTRDVGRLFLGKNLLCAQCHDHPIVFDYVQSDYYGIYAFLNRSFVFTDKKEKKTYFAEKAEGEVTFVSVFDPDKVKNETGPRLFRGDEVEEPSFEKGQEYEVKPAKDVRPIPKFSRREQLAKLVPTAANEDFKRNIANRLWALVMGRGIVHPLDMHHDDNPPSNPELLELLSDEFAATGFDVKAYLRELALSQTYQRSSLPPEGVEPPADETFAVALLKPLVAEQLAWSMMQATGLTDVERKALGEKLSEQALYDKLNGNVGSFVSIFGASPGVEESFQATMNQALFLSNGSSVRSWLQPRDGNLMDRLVKLSEPAAIADELYLSVLTRYATDDEKTEVANYLTERGDQRTAALQEIAWALLTSAEFRFNH